MRALKIDLEYNLNYLKDKDIKIELKYSENKKKEDNS